MDVQQQYLEATSLTGNDLKTIAHSQSVRELSSLSLPEIETIVNLVARLAPAGNVPGVILNGLARLPQRQPPQKEVKRDIRLLFKGVEQALKDRAVYFTFFAGPAAVLLAYQQLLKVTGRSPEAAFPEGTWQFYADYALRDDTARHACETNGFDLVLREHGIRLTAVNRLTAWVMAAIHTIHQYPALLENEWRERVYTHTLQTLVEASPDVAPQPASFYAGLYAVWEKKRPYSRTQATLPDEDYPTFRRRQFDEFLGTAVHHLPPALYQTWQKQIQEATALSAYQQQMSLLAYLEPGDYGETRTPIALAQAHVGLIHQGRYYLVPVCQPDTSQPADVHAVRAQLAALLQHPAAAPPAQLTELARVQRTAVSALRDQLDKPFRQELDMLRLAPIWLNDNPFPTTPTTLSAIRQAERTTGDHPLTIFDTSHSHVFDLSHIFFDGVWGIALAEIMTNEALAWAVYLKDLPPAEPGPTRPYSPALQPTLADRKLITQAPKVAAEASVETQNINLKNLLAVRKLFKQRSDLLQLTVNDLLILYRAIHATSYRLSARLNDQLTALKQSPLTHTAAQTTLTAITESQTINPTLLIPVDASRRSPRERVYPMAFEVPLVQLNLLDMHRKTLAAWQDAQKQKTARPFFEELRRSYLGALAGFAAILAYAKEVATAGSSTSVNTMRLLAHLPLPLQRLLDKIPAQFDVLNDLIKGREVFSNVGAVVPGSTLLRFITAKDDNEKKELAWGILTTADGTMHLTLRDFRPHVAHLTAVGQHTLAVALAQDYLDAYANGLNQYVAELRQITKE